jgi:transposase InsO family protein
MFQEVVRTEEVWQVGGGCTLNRSTFRTDNMHANATLTPLMRAKMISHLTTHHLSQRATAATYCVSEKTVRRWLARARQEGLQPRFEDRSSAPKHQPRKTSPQLEARILQLRRERRSYAQIRLVLPVSKATLSRVLRRHHLHRLSALEPPKPPVVRYERDLPGELLHLDIKKLGRFAQPGVRATGDRTQRNPGAGVESLHVAIDDHSRLAFACLLPDEKTPSVLDALQQAVSFYSTHGIKIQRLLTDRGSTYRSKLFAATCRQLGLKHLFTRPYRPQTNGKAERFIQTLTREWAYARPYDSSDHRAAFLPHYLHDYNFHRPHSALHSLPPSSRLPKTADNLSRINS